MIEPPRKLQGKKVLITGGLGMIGSTIAQRLANFGVEVTILDSCIEPYGANLFNVESISKKVKINIADIRDKAAMKVIVKGMNIVFNLAGQVSHNDSIDDPFLDADINYIGHLNILECLKSYNPEATVLHAGSRLQYGRIERIPVDENHALRPRTPYALNKAAAESMYRFYNEIHGIPCVLFRIANPYGPRSQMTHHKYSMVNWFIRQAMENKTIRIFGDGKQVRDYIFVADLAEAFIRAAVTEDCIGEVFNVGSGIGTSFKDMVQTILEVVGTGSIEFVPWPENYINVETGDYIAKINKISALTDWSPETDLTTGIETTFGYYKKYSEFYW